MIEGVKVKKLKVIPDERGRLMEMLRSDDDLFVKFGQVYMTTAYPGVVKGWHLHDVQWDNVVCVKGMIKLVLHDARDGSLWGAGFHCRRHGHYQRGNERDRRGQQVPLYRRPDRHQSQSRDRSVRG